MRTVAYFKHCGRTVMIRGYCTIGRHGQTMYRVYLDGDEIPCSWPNPKELEAAVRAILNEEQANG